MQERVQLGPELLSVLLALPGGNRGVLVTPHKVNTSGGMLHLHVQEPSRHHWSPSQTVGRTKVLGQNAKNTHSFVGRIPCVYEMKVFIHPRVFKAPSGLGYESHFNALVQHPDFQLIHSKSTKPSCIPVQHAEPFLVCVQLIAGDERLGHSRGLLWWRLIGVTQCPGKVMWSVAPATIP